jgi:outer membrane murein-binding lipoprotein Lpp
MRTTIKLSMTAALLGSTLLAGCAGTSGSTGTSGQGMQANPLSSDVSALQGMRAGSLDSEMNRLGFTNVGGYKASGASITTWWNPNGEQCAKVETRDGRVADIEPLFAGNCR